MARIGIAQIEKRQTIGLGDPSSPDEDALALHERALEEVRQAQAAKYRLQPEEKPVDDHEAHLAVHEQILATLPIVPPTGMKRVGRQRNNKAQLVRAYLQATKLFIRELERLTGGRS